MKDKKFNVVLYDQVNHKRIHEVVVHCFSNRDAKILGQAEFIKNALNIDDLETIVTEIL